MLSSRRFRFSRAVTIPVTIAALFCWAMGYWQYTRYVVKQKYFELAQTQEDRGLEDLDPATGNWTDEYHRQARVTGSFDFEHEVVLINRSRRNVIGVKLVTPLHIAGTDQWILVDRGFLPFEFYREHDPSLYRPLGELTLTGHIRPSQTKTFFLAPGVGPPVQGPWRDRWFRLDVAEMATQLKYPLLPVFFEMSEAVGEWPVPLLQAVLPASRHLNYTFQWFGFGVFALILGWFLQMRPIKSVRPVRPVEKDGPIGGIQGEAPSRTDDSGQELP